MGNTPPAGARPLGLLIDETLPVPNSGSAETPKGHNNREGDLLSHVQHLKVVQRIKKLVDTMTQAHDKQVMDAHRNAVCRLPAKGYGTTEFDMSDARVNALIAAGRNAMQAFFSRTLPT